MLAVIGLGAVAVWVEQKRADGMTNATWSRRVTGLSRLAWASEKSRQAAKCSLSRVLSSPSAARTAS